MKRYLAALAVTASAMSAGAATTASVDYSDLWWVPAESGWAAQLNQQGDVVFMTLFVFGSNGAGTWFSSDMRPLTFVAPAPPTYQGTLYRVAGPAFNGPFNPASVTAQSVGTATFTFTTPVSGTLAYTVDGVTVTKSVSRQTFRAAALAGSYNGGVTAASSGCSEPQESGYSEIQGPMTVTQAGAATTFVFTSNLINGTATRCTFRGDYTQEGRLGRISNGTFTCNVNTGQDDRGENPRSVNYIGTFVLDRIEAGPHGFYGNLTSKDQFCNYTGKFGGTRTAQ